MADRVRYVAKAMERDPWWEDESKTASTVHESDDDGFSGLYDSRGNPLFREKPPIGFKP